MGKHTQKQYFDEAGHFIIKPYRLKDLSAIFGVKENTLKRWMNQYAELEKKGRQHYTIIQVRLMIEKFGLPQKLCVAMPQQVENAA
jgi:hypothetical protein